MDIRQIKNSYTCFNYLGKPVRKVANGYLYRCPWRDDKHPSLSVTLNGRGWHDLATGDHGNVIDLVMRCKNTSFKMACEEIIKESPDFSSFPQPIPMDRGKEKGNTFVKFDVVPLQSPGLYAYLYHRKINIGIAKNFLQEARYSFKEGDGYLYALAYPNDKGGYELRSSRYKGCTTPKSITTHFYKEGASLIIFEGFTDMLSFATLCGEVRHNYIVLNSIVNIDATIETIRNSRTQFGSILLALDNDNGGTETTMKLLAAFPDAKDIRGRFAPFKDVNEYLCQRDITSSCHSSR